LIACAPRTSSTICAAPKPIAVSNGVSRILGTEASHIDEFGVWSYNRLAATTLFSLVSARYKGGSTILTSNQAFGEWGEVLGARPGPPSSIVSCTTVTC